MNADRCCNDREHCKQARNTLLGQYLKEHAVCVRSYSGIETPDLQFEVTRADAEQRMRAPQRISAAPKIEAGAESAVERAVARRTKERCDPAVQHTAENAECQGQRSYEYGCRACSEERAAFAAVTYREQHEHCNGKCADAAPREGH